MLVFWEHKAALCKAGLSARKSLLLKPTSIPSQNCHISSRELRHAGLLNGSRMLTRISRRSSSFLPEPEEQHAALVPTSVLLSELAPGAQQEGHLQERSLGKMPKSPRIGASYSRKKSWSEPEDPYVEYKGARHHLGTIRSLRRLARVVYGEECGSEDPTDSNNSKSSSDNEGTDSDSERKVSPSPVHQYLGPGTHCQKTKQDSHFTVSVKHIHRLDTKVLQGRRNSTRQEVRDSY